MGKGMRIYESPNEAAFQEFIDVIISSVISDMKGNSSIVFYARSSIFVQGLPSTTNPNPSSHFRSKCKPHHFFRPGTTPPHHICTASVPIHLLSNKGNLTFVCTEWRIYFFFGALCTCPLPLYPSDEIPEIGSEFCDYSQMSANVLFCTSTSNPHGSDTIPKPTSQITGKNSEWKKSAKYLQILIRSLLIFLIHRIRRRLSEHADGSEERETNTHTDGSIGNNSPALAWGWQGAGTVGTEGDIVCCLWIVLAHSFAFISILRPFPPETDFPRKLYAEQNSQLEDKWELELRYGA